MLELSKGAASKNFTKVEKEKLAHNKKNIKKIKKNSSRIIYFFLGAVATYFLNPVLNYYIDDSFIYAKLDEWSYKCSEGIDFCISMDQPERWINYDNFTKENSLDGKLIVKPIVTKNFPEGRMLYTKKKFMPDFKASVTVLPLGKNAANVVIEFENQLRCIVGDGDYRAIVCQKNIGFPTITNQWVNLTEVNLNKDRVYLQNSGMRAQTRFDLQFELKKSQQPDLTSTLKISFVPEKNFLGNNDEQNLSYEVGLPYIDSASSGSIGIGLLDLGHTDDISAIFGDLLVNISPTD